MVPLDASGHIHEEELRRYVSWLIDRGIHGLYPNGSTGEFLRFMPEERRRHRADRVPPKPGPIEQPTAGRSRLTSNWRFASG